MTKKSEEILSSKIWKIQEQTENLEIFLLINWHL